MPPPTGCHLGSLYYEFQTVVVTVKEASRLEGTSQLTMSPALAVPRLCEASLLAFPDALSPVAVPLNPSPGSCISWSCGVRTKQTSLSGSSSGCHSRKHLGLAEPEQSPFPRTLASLVSA